MCSKFQQDPNLPWYGKSLPVDGDTKIRVLFPGLELLMVKAGMAGPESVPGRWGLVPRWAKDLKIGRHTYNARSETIHEKPAFKEAFKDPARHCIIPADCFYEWGEVEGKKAQLKISRSDKKQLYFAGLWEEHAGLKIRSATIITTTPSRQLEPVHDRMPVILEESELGAWLVSGPEKALLRPWEKPLNIVAELAQNKPKWQLDLGV